MIDDVQNVFHDFIRSLGIKEQNFKQPEMINMEIGESEIFTAEVLRERQVTLSLFNTRNIKNITVYESLLGVCKNEAGSNNPLRAGILENRCFLSMDVPLDRLDVAVIHSSLKKLRILMRRAYRE